MQNQAGKKQEDPGRLRAEALGREVPLDMLSFHAFLFYRAGAVPGVGFTTVNSIIGRSLRVVRGKLDFSAAGPGDLDRLRQRATIRQ